MLRLRGPVHGAADTQPRLRPRRVARVSVPPRHRSHIPAPFRRPSPGAAPFHCPTNYFQQQHCTGWLPGPLFRFTLPIETPGRSHDRCPLRRAAVGTERSQTYMGVRASQRPKVRRLFAGGEWIRTSGSAILIMLRKTGLAETDRCTTEERVERIPATPHSRQGHRYIATA
jgi:hypothetical protein